MTILHAKYLEEAKNGNAPPTSRRPTLLTWCYRGRWRERVDQWEDAEVEREEEEWRAWRRELRLREREGASALMDLAQAILDEGPEFVKRKVVTKKGKTAVYIELDGDLAVRAMEAGSKIGRIAAGMETERQAIINITAEDLTRARAKTDEHRRSVIEGESKDVDE